MPRISTMSWFGLMTVIGLAVLPACAGIMEQDHGAMMEKGDTMRMDGSMAEPKKMMMKESSGAMMETGDSMMEDKKAMMGKDKGVEK